MRTVKRKTLSLNDNKQTDLEKLCIVYANEKNYWLDLLKNWDLQAQLGTPRKIRDKFVQEKYKSRYGLQARHWKLALQDAIETWDKYWQALFVQVRTKIHKLKRDIEKRYAYFLIKGYPQFAEMMQGKTPKANFEIDIQSAQAVVSYLRRQVKKLKKNPPTSKKARIAKFDADCYSVFYQNGRQYIKVMSLQKGKRIVIPLLGIQKIEGNITIVLKNGNFTINVSQAITPTKSKGAALEAVDFGYTEVVTDTQGDRYGTKFGEILSKATEHRYKKTQKRNQLHALEKKYKKCNPIKAQKLRENNLGNKKLNSFTNKTQASFEKEINTALNQLIAKRNPAILVTENLKHLFVYNKSKSVNRKFSSWIKGKLQDRVAFKALAEGFRHEQVNPAFGSQICPRCDFVDHKNRNGDKFTCLFCRHEDKSDRVAALNYARRFADQEIGLYMPYSQVKAFHLDRFHRRLETGQPVTVPGRTLETVEEIYPQKSFEAFLMPQPGELIFNRAVNQRAKQNEYV